MHRTGVIVMAWVVLLVQPSSAVGLDPRPRSLNGIVSVTTAEVVTSSATADTSRSVLTHCEISLSDQMPPEMKLKSAAKRVIVVPTNASGCNETDAIWALTVSVSGGNKEVDLLPVCRQFFAIEHVTIVGGLYRDNNESMTSLDCFRKLRHLTLRRADIATLNSELVSQFFRSHDIRSIEVSDSGVQELRVFDGHQLRTLKELNLSMNRLTTIVNATFVDIETLTSLNLSHNAIRHIAPNAFISTANRSSVKLGVADRGWTKLDTVDLSHNNLGLIDEQLFAGPLRSVRKLYLQRNSLTRLPRNMIDRLKQLVLVDLAYNGIVWLDVGAFSSTSLRHVDLSHNALRKLISMTFLYLPGVELIDLSHNQIRQVYKYAFYRVCKETPTKVADRDRKDSASDTDKNRRHVTISLRANELESDVIYRMMSMFRQQRRGVTDGGAVSKSGGGRRGCWMSVDLAENRIKRLLDEKAAMVLSRYDPGDSADERLGYRGAVEINLEANSLGCDCILVEHVQLLGRIAGGDLTWLARSNVAHWRQLPCAHRPETGSGNDVTVAEFLDGTDCTSEEEEHSTPSTRSTSGDHVIEHGEGSRRPTALDLRRLNFDGSVRAMKPEVVIGSDNTGHAQSTVKYLSTHDRVSRHFAPSGGGSAVIALALCAAMLALIGGLLLCRAGVRRSKAGGRIRRGRKRRDLFIVYAEDDEAWVTGTLLDIIFAHNPCYDVILHQHLRHDCGPPVTQYKCADHEQLVLVSVVDQSTMTVVVLSENFVRTVWSSSSFRSLLVSKVDAQRHRFLFVFLDDDVMRDATDPDIPDDRKQLYDCAATHGRLAATERNFAERLCDYLLPPASVHADHHVDDFFDSDESVALIGQHQEHQRY